MFAGKDELTLIQEDIQRALKKKEVKWAMLIDLRRCTSCKACTAGCVAEQKSPPGILYRPVYEEETGTFPRVKMRFTPRPCLHCDDPPCVEACPNKGEGKATWKSTKGISASLVMINYEQCIGCGRCVVACPYKARNLDAGKFYTEGTPQLEAYEKAPTWEYSRKWPREKYSCSLWHRPEMPLLLASAEKRHGAHVCEHLSLPGQFLRRPGRYGEPDL